MMGQIVELREVLVGADSGFASGDDVSDGTVQVRMNNIASDGTLDWSHLRRVPADQAKREKYELEPGDVLFNNTNSPELVGKTALFAGWHELVVFSNHFLRLRVDRDAADPTFIASWLHYQWKSRRFERLATRWVNQAAVRKDDLLDLQFDLPSLADQQRFSSILQQHEHLRAVQREGLRQVDHLFESLLDATFTHGTN